MYRYRVGADKDEKEDFACYEKALEGLGVAKDIRTAKQYFGEPLHCGYKEAALKL